MWVHVDLKWLLSHKYLNTECYWLAQQIRFVGRPAIIHYRTYISYIHIHTYVHGFKIIITTHFLLLLLRPSSSKVGWHCSPQMTYDSLSEDLVLLFFVRICNYFTASAIVYSRRMLNILLFFLFCWKYKYHSLVKSSTARTTIYYSRKNISSNVVAAVICVSAQVNNNV